MIRLTNEQRIECFTFVLFCALARRDDPDYMQYWEDSGYDLDKDIDIGACVNISEYILQETSMHFSCEESISEFPEFKQQMPPFRDHSRLNDYWWDVNPQSHGHQLRIKAIEKTISLLENK